MNIEEEANRNIQNMKHQVADFCKTMGFEFEIVHDDEEEEYDEDKEARDYEGGKEDYLYDNYVADQLEERDK